MAEKKLSKKALGKSFCNWFYGHLTCFSQEHMQTFGYLCAMLRAVGMPVVMGGADHARPAGQLAKEAGRYQSKIVLCKDDKKVESRRLMAVMGLAVKTGETLRFEDEGADEAEAGARIEAFCNANL